MGVCVHSLHVSVHLYVDVCVLTFVCACHLTHDALLSVILLPCVAGGEIQFRGAGD